MFLDRRCAGCGRPGSSVCQGCLAGPAACTIELAGLDATVALFAYEDVARRLILAGKNGARRDVLRTLGRALVVVAEGFGPLDAVTWVPASRLAVRRRGYDQGRVLASAVARPLGLRATRLLVRRGAGAQAGLGRAERMAGPALRARWRCPAGVLVVDDVITTGASMRAAGAALRRSGSTTVIGASLAIVGPDRGRAA